MKLSVSLSIALLLVPVGATAQPPGPWTDNFNQPRNPAIAQEARPFIIQRQGCDHFRGEPAYNEARRKFLVEQMEALCTGTDAELKRLRTKFADQPETIKALADFEDCIEYNSACKPAPVTDCLKSPE